MRPPCIETVTALALLAVPAAPAQQVLVTRPLDSASVVRLHLVQGSRVEAELVTALGPESGVIVYRPPFHRDCGVPRAVCQFHTPVTDVRAIEVPHGNHAGRGALIGAGVGGGLGFALGLAIAGTQYECTGVGPCGGGPSDAVVVSATTLVGAALGAGLGALFGVGSPAWRPAP